MTVSYSRLDARRLAKTVTTLRMRVGERFPGSGLEQIAEDLRLAAIEADSVASRVASKSIVDRLIGVLGFAILSAAGASMVWASLSMNWSNSVTDFVQGLNALLGTLVYAGVAVAFLASLETRRKRKVVQRAVRRLRDMAHVIDLHQLTKDPEMVGDKSLRHTWAYTDSHRGEPVSLFDLARYLNYCIEMLSAVGKIASVYVRGFHDRAAEGSVDDLETIAGDLSRKVAQKLDLLADFDRQKRC